MKRTLKLVIRATFFVALIYTVFPSGVSHAANLTLDWDAVTTNSDSSPITDLDGYMLYRATFSFQVGGVFISTTQAMANASIIKTSVVASTTTANLTGLLSGTSYYFRLTAFDTSGNHSAFNLNSSGQQVQIIAFTSSTTSPCDVNGNGSTDVVDLQLCVRQVLLLDPCTADINVDSTCNVLDVQLVVQAALTGQCVTP